MQLPARLAQPRAFYFAVAVAMHGEIVIGKQFRHAPAVPYLMRFALDAQVGGAVHGAVAVAQDVFLPVVFDMQVHILFRMDENFLFSRLVFDAQFIKSARALPAGRGHASEHRAGLVGRKFIGRRIVRIMDPPGDDGAIRVALQKADYHLLPDAGNGYASVSGPGPALRYAQPATGIRVP